MGVTPDDYPGICTVSAEALQELQELYTTNDDWSTYVEDWPPRDNCGNVYPIWFTADDLDDDGRLVDKHGHDYPPWRGNIEPNWHDSARACNAPLSRWTFRYPDIRYCRSPPKNSDDDFCDVHQHHEYMKSAEELVQSGAFTHTVDHLYEDLSPWKKLMGWGTFESLMGESVYEFAPETEIEVLDFSAKSFMPDEVDDEDRLEVEFSYPTDHMQPAMALYVAAMQQVTMMQVQSRTLWEGTRADGTEEGVMESQTVEKAQLTAPPSEHDSSPQQFKTIESWSEHHLNLPLSRLITDQPKLLEMGGVSTDPTDEADDIDADEIVLEVDANVDGMDTVDHDGTDPQAVGTDMTSQSEKIIQSTTTDDPDSDTA